MFGVTASGSVAEAIHALPRLGRPLSTDFGIFYAAGKLSSGGELARAYSLTALAHMQAALNDGHALRLPFSYPPYAAAALGLLARLPVPQAVALWTAANLAGFVAAGIIAVHRLPPRTRFLGILALVGCIPMVIATAQGENSGLVALGFTLALAGLEVPAGRATTRRRFERIWLIAPAFALLAFKPQFLVVPLLLVVVRHQKREFMAGAAGVAAVLTLGLVAGGLDGYGQFLAQLTRSLHWTTQYDFGPAFGYTLQAQLQSFLAYGPWTTICWLLGVGLVLLCFLIRLRDSEAGTQWLVAGAVAILVTTHVMFHDLALLYPLALPALATRLRWAALAILMAPWVDPGIYAAVHVHLVVVACLGAVVTAVAMTERKAWTHTMNEYQAHPSRSRIWKLFVRPRWASASGSETPSPP